MYVGTGGTSYDYYDSKTLREFEYYPMEKLLYTYYPTQYLNHPADSIYKYVNMSNLEELVEENYKNSLYKNIIIFSIIGCVMLVILGVSMDKIRNYEGGEEELRGPSSMYLCNASQILYHPINMKPEEVYALLVNNTETKSDFGCSGSAIWRNEDNDEECCVTPGGEEVMKDSEKDCRVI